MMTEPVRLLLNQEVPQRLIGQRLKLQLLPSHNTHVMSVAGLNTIGDVTQAKIHMAVSDVLTVV